jgi:hypothetical protein
MMLHDFQKNNVFILSFFKALIGGEALPGALTISLRSSKIKYPLFLLANWGKL